MKAPPTQPENSFRVLLKANKRVARLDTFLLEALREQERNLELQRISRSAYKKLFTDKRILIKGQNAKPSSAVAAGETYVDILGFSDES